MSAADVEAIKKVHEREVAAFNAGDIESYTAIITDDAVVMAPNQPAIIGKEAIRPWFQDFFKLFTIQLRATSEEVVVGGDWAFERFSFAWMITPVAGGKSNPDNGKGIHIYQRQPDGSWKIARDNWNSNNPPPER